MGIIITFKKGMYERGGIYMCPPINRLRGRTAMDVLEKFGNPDDIPIDLTKIVAKIGISVLPMDFSELEKKLNKGQILGLVIKNQNNAAIYYDKNSTPNRQRFTIAHELGHICQDLNPDSKDYPYIDWRIKEEETKNDKEINANKFAGELLIPFNKLRDVYMSMDFLSSSELASRFGVSCSVMEERLNQLGVSYYDTRGRVVTRSSK